MEYKLIIDSREQRPLPFVGNVFTKCLKVGDYAAEYNNILLPVIFDRKNPSDWAGTLVQGHERFVREIGRAHKLGFKLIVIVECSYTKFITKKYKGSEHSTLSPLVLTKILHSTMISHDLEVIFCKNRKEMMTYIKNYFHALKNSELKNNGDKYEHC